MAEVVDLNGEYSSEEFEQAKANILSRLTLSPVVMPSNSPQAFLLGGQSGAGKTTLHGMIQERFGYNVIVVNGDGFRSYHPRYRQLDKEYGPESVNYTAKWAGSMTEAVVEALSLVGYNLAVEGTLRTAEVPTKTATLLKERGYRVFLAVMAVKPEISLISCQIRYEQMRIAGTVPRATDPEHHNLIIRQIVSNMRVLEQSDLFEGIYLVNRAKEVLYPKEGLEGKASDALEQVLFGPWSREESIHYDYLKQQYKELQGRVAKGVMPRGRSTLGRRPASPRK